MKKIDYKKSKYNYITKNGNKYIIYNTLYNALSRLDEEEYQQYINMKFDSEDVKEEFCSQGFIVKENINALQFYNTYALLSAKYMKSKPNLTVPPTMECNARCFYCYEQGVRCGKMTIEHAEKIVEKIKCLDVSKGINLTWFGGEPLMNQEWMDIFSEMLKKEKIDFSAFIISNGSKINDDIIKKMKNVWNIHSIQITFDGSNEEYVKRKAYVDQDENIYYNMFQKIKKLSKAGISVQIRLNIDRANVESILETVNDLQQVFYNYNNVSFYPAFLTGSKNALKEQEKIEIIKKIIELNKNMLSINSYLYKLPKTSACYFNQKFAFSIDVNGDIFNCERKLGHHQEAVGNIYDDMDLNNDIRVLSGQRGECQKCVFLPKCQGGCNDAYQQGEEACFIDKYIIKAYLELL